MQTATRPISNGSAIRYANLAEDRGENSSDTAITIYIIVNKKNKLWLSLSRLPEVQSLMGLFIAFNAHNPRRFILSVGVSCRLDCAVL